MSSILSWCTRAQKAAHLSDLIERSLDMPLGAKVEASMRQRIPAVLMGLYLTRKFPISRGMQKEFSRMFVEAGKRGHSFQGTISKRPVWSYILQFRFFAVYPFLDLPPRSHTFMSIHLGGYIGALVKMARNVISQESTIETVISERQSHFHCAPVLEQIKKHSSQDLPMELLRNVINELPTLELRPEQINRPYQVQVHPKVPKQHRYIIHDAVMNGHTPLFTELLNKETVKQVDFWRRNVAHLGAIFSFADIQQLLATYPQAQAQKDGFGRTSIDIQRWKQTLVQTAPSPKLDQNNGGWDPKIAQDLQTQRADIDIIHYKSTSWNAFAQNYLSVLKPVLLRGVPNVERLQRLWRKDSFQKRYRHMPLAVGDIPYGASLGRQTHKRTVETFQSQPNLYAFCPVTPKEHQPLLKDIPPLAWFGRFPTIQTQLYQGVVGTGSPMHMHVDAWNLLVHGQKRWFLAPPFQGVYSATPILDWLSSYQPKAQILECTQYAGDILYVPKYWSHAVVNTQECVGFAREFFQPYAI